MGIESTKLLVLSGENYRTRSNGNILPGGVRKSFLKDEFTRMTGRERKRERGG